MNSYIISNNGLGIAVGITGDRQQAIEDAILAENLYGCNHNDSLFTYMIYMSSVEQFKKFLILKEYFRVWDEHFGKNTVSGRRNAGDVMRFTRRAIKRARLIMESQVKHQNFMQQISSRNNEYMIGGYQDEAGEE
jgi:hypothetical protein